MKLTTERKALAVVLAVAVSAFLVDRFVIGSSPPTPNHASGADPQAAAEPAPDAPAAPAEQAQPTESPPRAMLADRLEQLAGATGVSGSAVGDAFAAPAGWAAPAAPAAPAAARPSVNSPQERARLFAESHRLAAIVLGGKEPQAIIDGQCLAVGQTLEGFRLTAVGRDSATLEREGAAVTLPLSRQQLKGRQE